MNSESQTSNVVPAARLRLQGRMAAHPFLKGLRDEHLATLAVYAMETEFSKGDTLFREGDIANRFYLLDEGTVSLQLRVHLHPPVVLQTVAAGRCWDGPGCF